jgi:very-short-patch-repair endonuclease
MPVKIVYGVNDFETWCKQNNREDLLDEWGYDKNDGLVPQDIIKCYSKKVWWVCKENHEWQATIHNRVKGSNCPYCSGRNAIVGKTDLATVNPELIKEWDFDKNKTLPQNYKSGSGVKVWWKCKENHSWLDSIKHRKEGRGCPYCGGKRVLVGYNDLVTIYPNLVKEWNYKKNDNAPHCYTKGSKKKVWWNCDKGHEWKASICNRTNGEGCPICANKQILVGFNDLNTTNPNLTKEWNYEKNITTPEEYTSGSGVKVWWKCENGHAYIAKIVNRTRGQGCPYCSNKKILYGFNDLETQYPNLMKEWDYEKNTDITPTKVTMGSVTRVWWKCKKGHSWKASINHRVHGIGCPICSNKQVLSGYNDLATTDPILAKQWNYSKNIGVTPKDVTRGMTKNVWWVCEKGHEWRTTINRRTANHTGCPYCSGSKTERLVYSYLKELKISFIAEKKFEQDSKVKGFPFDIWIASKRLIIEPDGLQHFKEECFPIGTTFDKYRQHDNIKNEFCLEHRISILRIPYIYNPYIKKTEIQQLVKDFVETRKVPDEIIEFYEQYKEDNNYAEVAREINKLAES